MMRRCKRCGQKTLVKAIDGWACIRPGCGFSEPFEKTTMMGDVKEKSKARDGEYDGMA